MSDEIRKPCSKCGVVKPLSEFYGRKNSEDGRRNDCKECFNVARKTRYSANLEESRSAGRRSYRANREKKIAYIRGWEKTHPEWVSQKQKRYRLKHPSKKKARAAVNNAVRDGKLLPANRLLCSKCGNQAQQYHHFKGYAQEHWLDIEPLCINCHAVADHSH